MTYIHHEKAVYYMPESNQTETNPYPQRIHSVERKTAETDIRLSLNIDGRGKPRISTGIPFFDHMLTLFTVHGRFDLTIEAEGDIEVDYHHTVEDVGLVLGDAFSGALGDKKGIVRYGYAVTPMDETLSSVAVDLSGRPFLVFNTSLDGRAPFDALTAKEFFRAFSNRCGMNLHINVMYGENEHHILESIFKGTGRAMDSATAFDPRLTDVLSSKGVF